MFVYIHIVTLYLGKRHTKESSKTEPSDNADKKLENVEDNVKEEGLPTAAYKKEANEDIIEKCVSSNISSPFKVVDAKDESSASLEKLSSPSADETSYTFKTALPQMYSTRHKRQSVHRKSRHQHFQSRMANQQTLRKYKINSQIEREVNDLVHHRRLVCHGQWN